MRIKVVFDTNIYIKFISKTAAIVKTKAHIKVLTDDPDNRILECALKTKADYIVTGDKHLLSLKTFERVSILSLSDFVGMINQMNPQPY